ncbi:hypothetical protein Gohar_006051 [Gossypium harknessii]|uniref:Uncharacterized protein n=1 Tax=Gossypium harknessii TaxID=34285 RepID=A0A7J9GCD3_9ROSI|nr:hypothetical protein [Gossypium harknessii]
MCSCPVIVCAYAVIRFYLKAKRKNNEKKSYVDVSRSNGPSLKTLKSVRRNARMEVLEWDRKENEEMNKFSPRSPYECGGDASGVETRNDRVLDGSNGGGGRAEVESIQEGEEENDDRKKGIEWTKHDRENVMTLGTLESERNQRLESLMVKRRARKLFKMAVDKNLMNKDAILPSHLAPVMTAKSNLLGGTNDPYEEILQMPGSAPSIWVPKDNPFDLPYDPHEEKPNLAGNSFHQEFMTVNQKEMLFCRHESFCRRTWLTQDSNDAHFNHYYSTQRSLVEDPTDPRFKWQSNKGGDHHHNFSSTVSDVDIVELDESNHENATNSLEGKHEMIREIAMGSPHDVKMEIDSININDSCYTSSSEDTELVLDQTSKSPEICRDQMQKSLNLLVPPKGKTLHTLPYDFNPSPAERPRPEFNLFYGTYNRHRPTSTCSVASDLQVEVSEVGSPPLTTTGSSIDGESVTYDDSDVDGDIRSDREVWGEANGEKPKELHDIIEEDPVKVDLSGLKTKPDEPNASHQKTMEELNVKPITQRASSVSDSKSYESKTPLESKKKMEKCQPGDAPNAVQSREKLIENNDSGSKQRFDYPIVMALNQRLLIEQVPENKFSSPSNSSLETFKVSNTFKGLGVIYKYRNILYAMLLGLQGVIYVHARDAKGESQIISREKAVPVVEQATGAASTLSVEDTKHETERLTEAKANSGLSTSAGESGKEGG